MDTLICPRGHSDIENRLNTNVNRGLTCRVCDDVMVCEECGESSRRNRRTMAWPGVEWVSNKTLFELGLIDSYNRRDGGVYGVCQACRRGIMVKQSHTSWMDLDHFGRDGGRAMRLEVPGKGRRPYIIGRDQLVALCEPHAKTYRENYEKLIQDVPGTLTESTPCTFCFPPYPGRIQGPVLYFAGHYYTTAADLTAAMRKTEEEVEAIVDFVTDNAGRIAGVRVLTEEEAERAEEEAQQGEGGQVSAGDL